LNQSRSSIPILLLLVIILVVIGFLWADYRFVGNKVSGEGFLVQWLSIRGLMTSGISPYNDQVTKSLQQSVKFGNDFIIGDSIKYTSPLYSAIAILPFTLIKNQTLAHTLWQVTQFLGILLILFIGIQITGWKPAWYIWFFFLFFTLFSYHVIIPWLDGGLSIWAAFFLALAFLAIRDNRDEFAGLFLALAAFQPLMVILPLLFILIWAASRRKSLLIIWFFATLILLSIVGILVAPDWIIQYLRVLYNFNVNFAPGSPSVLFGSLYPGLGKQLAWVLSGVLVVVLVIEWWRALRKDFRWFLWTVCLTIVISQWIGIPTTPSNFSGLIFPLILVCAALAVRWPRGGQWAALIITGLVFIWEWALFYLNITGPEPKMQLNLLIPLPLILLVGLYWVRWWAIKPKRLLIEELRLAEA
jgi:Glycosyltransferase family 87